AMGAPGCGYPWPWSVYRWLPGEPAATARPADRAAFAADLAGFLAALYRIDTAGGPPPGEHSCFRGAPLTVWDAQVRRALKALGGEIEPVRRAQGWAGGGGGGGCGAGGRWRMATCGWAGGG